MPAEQVRNRLKPIYFPYKGAIEKYGQDAADAILKAHDFAVLYHDGQMYGNFPYIFHIEAAYETYLKYFPMGVSTETFQAIMLHDVLEDTEATREQLVEEFSLAVSELVWAVTGVGRNRREKNEAMYAKLRLLPSAISIKLADRIANVESCWETRDSRLFMYHREYKEFRSCLSDYPGNEQMWEHLDTLMGYRR